MLIFCFFTLFKYDIGVGKVGVGKFPLPAKKFLSYLQFFQSNSIYISHDYFNGLFNPYFPLLIDKS